MTTFWHSLLYNKVRKDVILLIDDQYSLYYIRLNSVCHNNFINCWVAFSFSHNLLVSNTVCHTYSVGNYNRNIKNPPPPKMNVLFSGFQYSQINVVRRNLTWKAFFLTSILSQRTDTTFHWKWVETIWWMTSQQLNLTRDINLLLSDMQLYRSYIQPTHYLR